MLIPELGVGGGIGWLASELYTSMLKRSTRNHYQNRLTRSMSVANHWTRERRLDSSECKSENRSRTPNRE